jgi:hypothetical protein
MYLMTMLNMTTGFGQTVSPTNIMYVTAGIKVLVSYN